MTHYTKLMHVMLVLLKTLNTRPKMKIAVKLLFQIQESWLKLLKDQ